MAANARRLAVEALVRIHQEGSYSNTVLDAMLNSGGRGYKLTSADQALLSRLYYGVLERLLTLDYIIEQHSSVKLKKINPVVLELLRLGCYQLVYMDKIPPSAAVNESVKLAKVMRQGRSSGYINAVLRAIERGRSHLLDDLTNDIKGLSIKTSCPVELLKLWKNAYGEENTRLLAEYVNGNPPNTIRVNTLKMTANAFEELLTTKGLAYKKHPHLASCFDLVEVASIKRLAQIDQSCYYHQDTASQYACKSLEAQPGESIADVCAAPGGKSLTIAQMMENKGEILSSDIHSYKCDGMEKRAYMMGASIIRTAIRDASEPCPESLTGSFDRVLCDVPCSGLGVIRRKPEIRYKPIGSFKELPELQYKILHESSKMVKDGGVLQYSTCTLNPAENEHVAERFLKEHTNFSPRILQLRECFDVLSSKPSHMISLFPHIHNTDGFFIAGFIKTQTI